MNIEVPCSLETYMFSFSDLQKKNNMYIYSVRIRSSLRVIAIELKDVLSQLLINETYHLPSYIGDKIF